MCLFLIFIYKEIFFTDNKLIYLLKNQTKEPVNLLLNQGQHQ